MASGDVPSVIIKYKNTKFRVGDPIEIQKNQSQNVKIAAILSNFLFNLEHS